MRVNKLMREQALMRDGKLFPSIFVFFTSIFGLRKV